MLWPRETETSRPPLQHRSWPTGISKDSRLGEEVGSRDIGTWAFVPDKIQAWLSVFSAKEWALNGKGKRDKRVTWVYL